ncbi:MAG: RidA family protein [Pygmaiobacter sp.]
MSTETKMENPIPQGKYVPANRAGNLIYSAGMTPRVNGVLLLTGKVKASEPLESYRNAVRQAAANALTAVRNALTEGESIAKIVTMSVFIQAEEGYTTHAKLADFASDYLCEQLGDRGIVSRAAIGVASLPGDAPVEIQLVAVAE